MSCLAKQTEFFSTLWNEYIQVTPLASDVRQLFIASGDKIINDHVAFRTFNLAPINIQSLESHVLSLGYQYLDSYEFPNKYLKARAYIPTSSVSLPRVFLSELSVEKLSHDNQVLVRSLCKQIDPKQVLTNSIFFAGRLWNKVSWSQYQALLKDSEYAAWLAVMGLRANHFTVSINALNDPNIERVVSRLLQAGFQLNEAGGVIKGDAGSSLRQCATLADTIEMTFLGGDRHSVSSCYYEFAWRGHDARGKLFEGFVADNADKIFTSTDVLDQAFGGLNE